MKFLAVLTLASLGIMLSQSQAQEKPNNQIKSDEKTEVKRLLGTYKITAGERNGKKLEADQLKDVTIRIEEKVITTFDKDKKEFYAATYEVDTQQKPWKVLMTATIVPIKGKGTKVDGKGTQAEGLIEISGESVRLIYALPEGKAPTEFKTDDKQQMFVMVKTEKQEPSATR